jgi:hypothetical protein
MTFPMTSGHAMTTWGHPLSRRRQCRCPPALRLHRCSRGAARTEATKMDRGTLLGAPVLVGGGGPKRQRAEEAELGSGGPTPKRPRMVVSR